MKRIVFVCTWNIARSPMAAAIFRSMAKKHPRLRRMSVDSAGTEARDGERPSEYAVAAMDEMDLDIRGHRSRWLTPDRVAPDDLVLTMDRQQVESVRELGVAVEVMTLGDYAGIPGDVPAPWESHEEYATCRE